MFNSRCFEKELLDADHIPTLDLYRNLQELNFINKWLGGHDITIKGIQKFAHCIQGATIADIGCGGGDNLIAIAKWARKNNFSIKLVGIDIKDDCIAFAQNNCKDYPEISFIQSDYNLVNQKFDIIFSALFCHHLNDEQLLNYLEWSNNKSIKGFFINDLHRNFLAYYSIKWLTFLFSKSYLVKNDAPLSVLRGFAAGEWQIFKEKSKLLKLKINWKWAFRYLVWDIK